MTSAIGNPITITSTINRTAQFGISKNGNTWVATCTNSQPTLAYATATLPEQPKRFALLAKREMNDGKRIGAHILLRGKVGELIEDFTGFPHATGLGIGVRKHGKVRRRRT